MREAERQHAFGARLHRHPLVGAGAGQRHARFDLHERAAHARPSLPHRAVGGALRDRRIPGAEEVGAEADREARRARDRTSAAARGRSSSRSPGAARRRRRARRRSAAARRTPSANSRGERACGGRGAAASGTRATSDPSAAASASSCAGELGDRLVPGDRRELAGAARAGPLQRLRQAIGVIGDLNRRLAARAQAALADRIRRRSPSSFFATPIFTTPAWPLRVVSTSASMTRTVSAAAGRAQRADARLPLRDAGHEVLVGHEADELVLRDCRSSPAWRWCR